MTNSEKIFRFLSAIAPAAATNSDIRARTGVAPHQQVFQITQSLMHGGKIQGRQRGREWEYWVSGVEKSFVPPTERRTERNAEPFAKEPALPSTRFEQMAREVMSGHYGAALPERKIPGVNKIFDFVSPDGKIVGDAKFFTLVGGERSPSAKFSIISEHAWLLAQTGALRTFLVFGNDIRVPERWLKKYDTPDLKAEFYFLSTDRNLTRLK